MGVGLGGETLKGFGISPCTPDSSVIQEMFWAMPWASIELMEVGLLTSSAIRSHCPP